MLVYRYFNEQFGLLALQQRKRKIGRLLELNDPLDCQPTLFRSNQDEDLLIEDDPFLSEIYNMIGILCYSTSIEDPVIWSHYADCHRGMALGFDLPENELLKVRYPEDDARARLNQEELEQLRSENLQKALLDTVAKGFSKKARGWAYECEYRQFISLDHCEMIGPHYFRGMPLPHLKHIVLGVRSRITLTDVVRIRQSWTEQHYIPITKAEIDRRSYRLEARMKEFSWGDRPLGAVRWAASQGGFLPPRE
jgi:hypothetical protein